MTKSEMKENFFNSFFMEKGTMSSRRLISIMCSATICWGSCYTIVHDPAKREPVLNSLMLFVAVMSGITTVTQVTDLIRGRATTQAPAPVPEPKPEPSPEQPEAV